MKRFHVLLAFVILLFFPSIWVAAQYAIGSGQAKRLYERHCLSCHGENLREGLGGSLLDRSAWQEVGKTTTFLNYVKEGNAAMGMPSFDEALSDSEIRALDIYIAEVAQIQAREKAPVGKPAGGVFESEDYRFTLETVVDGLAIPWSVAFVNTDTMLIAERGGALRRFKTGKLLDAVEGTPTVYARGQGGLMEVALHPNFEANGWIYLGFSDALKTDGRKSMTKVVRGRILDNRWRDEETIWAAPAEFYKSTGVHFGTRLTFRGGYLFFGIGDRGAKEEAQDLSLPNGKIHRVFDDGRVPADNPFTNDPEAYPTVWTYGNRNPQGLDLHPGTNEIWESEHGPRGGDEINLIERGVNYGWPKITHGMNYGGSAITEKTSAPGMAQPKLYWTPSIAVCGMDFYEGEALAFPNWRHDLFVGGLASEEVHRLVIEDREVVKDEIIMADQGRVRDIASGPDGHLYVVLNGPGRIVRLVAAE